MSVMVFVRLISDIRWCSAVVVIIIVVVVELSRTPEADLRRSTTLETLLRVEGC